MLRKRSRSFHKEQEMGDQPLSDSSGCDSQSKNLGFNHKSKPLFSLPVPFVGLSFKGLSDCDSVRSPTSPLEFRVFSSFGNPFRSPISSAHDGHHKSLDCCKVGLGIVDSLDNDVQVSGKIILSSESRNIIFGPRVRTKTPFYHGQVDSIETPRSLPKDFAILPQTQVKSPLQKGNSNVVFEIGDTPLEPVRETLRSCPSHFFCNYGPHKLSSGSRNICVETMTSQMSSPSAWIGESLNVKNPLHTHPNSVPESMISSNEFNSNLSANEIELSEDYTCVISRGPNPKLTRIFCDCILECHANDSGNFVKNEEETGLPQVATRSHIIEPYFLSYCHFCNKKLEDGKDIYIYKGDQAFCSLICRAQEIMIDEEIEKSANRTENSPKLDKGGKLFEPGLFVLY